MARRRIADKTADRAQIAAVSRSGLSAEDGARTLQKRGVAISARTLSRRRKEALDRAQAARAANPRHRLAPSPVRTAEHVLRALPLGDRTLVEALVQDVADEAVAARDAQVDGLLRRLGREQAAQTPCPACGLRGLPEVSP